MRCWKVAGLFLVSLVYTTPSYAEPKSGRSSGLKATVSSISLLQNNQVIGVQFTIANTSQRRQYFYIVTGNPVANAGTSAGKVLPVLFSDAGAVTCNSQVEWCLTAQQFQNHNVLSYVDPGEDGNNVVVTIQYGNGSAILPNETISLPLILIVRPAASEPGDIIQKLPLPPQTVRISFPHLTP